MVMHKLSLEWAKNFDLQLHLHYDYISYGYIYEKAGSFSARQGDRKTVSWSATLQSRQRLLVCSSPATEQSPAEKDDPQTLMGPLVAAFLWPLTLGSTGGSILLISSPLMFIAL